MNTLTDTPTPRVDAEICRASHSNGSGGEEEWEYVEPEIARQLERELAEANADNARLREALEWISIANGELASALRGRAKLALRDTPPPPVVPTQTVEKLAKIAEACSVADDISFDDFVKRFGFGQGNLQYAATEALSAYRNP